MNQQQIRPYIMALYDLQDGFRSILKAPGAEGQGCVQDAEMTLKDDRTQELKFSVPMYIRENGELKENPIWYTTQDGNMVVGMRKIKVIFGDVAVDVDDTKVGEVLSDDPKLKIYSPITANKNQTTQTLFLNDARIITTLNSDSHTVGILKAADGLNTLSIFEFVITKVTETHDKGVLTCEVEAEGLAFQELGKTGYKISLSQDDYDTEYSAYFDGIIAEKSPFQSYENLQIDEQDSTGYTLDLTFTEYQTNDDNESVYVLRDNASVTLAIDTSEGIDIDKTYTFSFYCTQNLDEKITWSINGGETKNLASENKITGVKFDKAYNSISVQFYRNGETFTNIPLVSSFKLCQEEEVIANINYWADKVLDGTRWTYSVQTDWSSYDGKIVKNYDKLGTKGRSLINAEREKDELRRMDKVYEDEYVSAWTDDGKPSAYEKTKEKERIVEASESNRFNILQDIAEKFEVNCKMVYHYDDYFRIVGREVVFYNNFIKDMDAIDVTYPYDANKISREMDCADIVTKMFVKSIDDDTNMVSGKISISDAPANLSKEDYILNFDYLYDIGSISKDQMNEVEKYELDMKKYNTEMDKYSTLIASYETALTNAKSDLSECQTSKKNAAQQITDANKQITSILGSDRKVSYENEPDTAIVTTSSGTQQITINNTGIEENTLFIYEDRAKTKKLSWKDPVENGTAGTTTYTLDTTTSVTIVYCYYTCDPTLYWAQIVTDYTKVLKKAIIDEKNYKEEVSTYQKNWENNKNSLYAIKKEKEERMAEFERYMGSAIREGNWQDDDYTDIGNKNSIQLDGAQKVFNYDNDGEIIYTEDGTVAEEIPEIYYTLDSIPFDDEQLLYYEYGVTQEKKYYYYIDIPDKFSDYNDLFLCYNNTWVKVDKSSIEDTSNVKIWSANTTYKKGDHCYVGTGESTWWESTVDDNINNLPGTNSNVDYISIDSGLTPAIVKIGGEIKLVLLLTGDSLTDDDIEAIKEHGYFVEIESGLITNDDGSTSYIAIPTSTTKALDDYKVELAQATESDEILYSRIKITNMLLKVDDNLQVYIGKEAIANKLLTAYEDYSTLARYASIENNEEECYCLTIKPQIFMEYRKEITPQNAIFNVNYTVSNAAVSVYLDAKKVSRENAYPQVSYDIDINAVQDGIVKNLYNRLDQICHINDFELKFNNVRGYITEVELHLDNPWEDKITIQNYKSKFEDLFSSIVASTEQMKTNGTAYNRAANSFLSTGALTSDTISDSINNNVITYNFDKGKLTISEENGIWASSSDGVVAIRSGGISVASQQVDGEWQWHTGITPNGINASLLNAGQINLERIFIYSGNDVAYQMNSSGLYAYRNDAEDGIQTKEYVVHNGEGLFLTNEKGMEYTDDSGDIATLDQDINRVEISWDGLIIRNLNNEKVFYADNDGNLTLAGAVNASAGSIGEWLITDNGLVSQDGRFGITPNSETGNVIWVNGSDDNYFSVDSDGVLYGTSGVFTESLIAENATFNGVPMSVVIEKVGIGKGIFATALIGDTFFLYSDENESVSQLKYIITSYDLDEEPAGEDISIEYEDEDGNWQIIFNPEEEEGVVYYFYDESNYLTFTVNSDIMEERSIMNIRFVYGEYYTESISLSKVENYSTYTISITADNGICFKNGTGSTTLTAHVYMNGEELSKEEINENYVITWKESGNETPLGTGITYDVYASDIGSLQTYFCELEKA